MQDSSKSTDLSHVAVLKEKQEQTLQLCQEKLNRWLKFRDDYVALEKKLETLADNLTYDTTVPFGNAGMMRGKLIHTNEIMVLLGDNWFVERSSKQAAGIAKRRIKQCDEAIEGCEREKVLIQNWLNFTDRTSEEATKGFTEITEPYDAEKEKLWKEQHKESLRKEKLFETVNRQQNELEDMWKKLDQLQQQEIQRHELQRDTDNDDDDSIAVEEKKLPDHKMMKDKSKPAKKVGWLLDDNNEAACIPASETEQKDKSLLIQSPSDIYKYFGGACNDTKIPKSILKPQTKQLINETVQEPSLSFQILDDEPPVKFANTEKAFPGMVLERMPEAASAVVFQEEFRELPRPVSKFKAQRTKSQ